MRRAVTTAEKKNVPPAHCTAQEFWDWAARDLRRHGHPCKYDSR